MGLFSKKKKTYVSSVSYNLAGDDVENFATSIISNSILSGSANGLATDIVQSYLKGQGMKLRQAYDYGRDHYSLGLPTSSRTTGSVDVSTVEPIIESITGNSVLISETYIGSPDYAFWVYQYLGEHYGYDESTGEFLTPPPGVSATDAVVTSDITTAGTVKITLTNPDSSAVTLTFTATIDNTANYIYVPYRTVTNPQVNSVTTQAPYQDGDEADTTVRSTSVRNGGQTITTEVKVVTTIDEAKTITTTVTTTTVGITSQLLYFIYRLGAGVYPALDALASTSNLASPYYPWVIMRDNNKDMTAAQYQDTDQYRTAKKLLNKAGLKMTDLAKAINTNDNIGDIDFAFIHFGISINTVVQESKAYLYNFMLYLQAQQKYSALDWDTWYEGYNNYLKHKKNYQGDSSTNYYRIAQPGNNSISIRYDNKNWYNVTISWQYVKTVIEPMVIGSIGHVEITSNEAQEITIWSDEKDTIEQYSVDASTVLFRKQISASQVQTLIVRGLQHDNKVYDGKSVTTSAYKALAKEEDELGNFIVPLNRQVFDAMGIVDVTQTCYDCMHVTFNCYKVVKQKWYQTSIFKIVVIVIAVVITVLSWGTLSAPAAAVATAAAAAGATATVALVAGILTQVAIGVAVSVAMKIVAQYISPDLFAVFSIAMLAYGAYAVGSNYAATSQFSASTSLASSQTYMSAVNTTLYGYQQSINYQVKDLAQQMSTASQSYTDAMTSLTEAWDSLGEANKEIDLYGMQDSYFNLFESPSAYIARTTTTNTVSMMLEGIQSFTGNALNISGGLLK